MTYATSLERSLIYITSRENLGDKPLYINALSTFKGVLVLAKSFDIVPLIGASWDYMHPGAIFKDFWFLTGPLWVWYPLLGMHFVCILRLYASRGYIQGYSVL